MRKHLVSESLLHPPRCYLLVQYESAVSQPLLYFQYLELLFLTPNYHLQPDSHNVSELRSLRYCNGIIAYEQDLSFTTLLCEHSESPMTPYFWTYLEWFGIKRLCEPFRRGNKLGLMPWKTLLPHPLHSAS